MRLVLNRRTDYGLRAMVALASDPGSRRPARRIASRMAIPPAFVGPILADLSRAGLVTGKSGPAGGYQLARDASDIVLRDVVEALEIGDGPTRCSLADRMCHPEAHCAMHPIWAAASAAYLETFGAVTLATLAMTDGALREGVLP